MNAPRLVVGDGHLGIWGALRNVWPEVDEQRCWNHKVLNVLEQLPRRQQAVARSMLRAIASASTRAEAERKRQEFAAWCHRHGDGKAAEVLGRDRERMVTFYRYPKEHGRHLRTTNVVEAPFAAVRLGPAVHDCLSAPAGIGKRRMGARTRFRRLRAPDLLAKVYAGARDEDGMEVTETGAAA